MRLKSVALFIICFFMAGCQQTPDSIVVVNKSHNILDTLEESDSYIYQAPASIQFSEKKNGLDISYNATIHVPQVSAYSVIEVEKETYSDQDYQRLMNYFEPNKRWFNRPALTKSEILEMLSYHQTNDYLSSNNEYINMLKDRLLTAPDKAELIEFHLDTCCKNEMFIACCENNNAALSSFLANYQGNDFQYIRADRCTIMREEYLAFNDPYSKHFKTSPQIGYEAAAKVVEKVLADIGIDSSMKLLYAEKAIAIKSQNVIAFGWDFVYTRDCNGLRSPFIDNFDIWNNTPMPSNAAPWEMECLFITIDEHGVFRIDYRGAGNQTKVLKENISLLSFENILRRISQQLVYQHAYYDKSIEDIAIVVNEINMVSSLIDMKDNPNKGIVIPSWHVIYTLTSTGKDGKATHFKLNTLFSAIDGSYIEPRISMDDIKNIYANE